MKWIIYFVLFVLLVYTKVIFFPNEKQNQSQNFIEPIISNLDENIEEDNYEVIEEEIFGFPVSLKIPGIKVDINIENVGITSKGEMDIPKSFSKAGWFNLGPRPGEKGVAVLAGHFGFEKGIPGVFNDLHKLNIGDKIYIEDENGIIITFVIRKFKTYKQNYDTFNVFNSYEDKSHLNLITCQGVWDETKKSYPYRLVVFSDREK